MNYLLKMSERKKKETRACLGLESMTVRLRCTLVHLLGSQSSWDLDNCEFVLYHDESFYNTNSQLPSFQMAC